jgi:hypothetical protein
LYQASDRAGAVARRGCWCCRVSSPTRSVLTRRCPRSSTRWTTARRFAACVAVAIAWSACGGCACSSHDRAVFSVGW